ncbi:homoprotocatechuate degradation operon regulator HpaR [Nitratireductor sp. XY-223]|uniref:homoprotocatechuate degradation operon regulator HpaR n=1 Tax=Nitratireductor sp. XY-223 TaxID=2561926 RepID=UPI0010A9E65D|nr:homoprotocatechuate degradation operon regulator HpaR [Nitratireductor sp. XY-223]
MSDKKLRATSRALPIALLRARETVMGQIRPMLADAGVTEQQWRVLRVLAEDGGMDPTDIAEKSCLLLPSLTRILKFLEENGLVTRKRHETDGRRHLVQITDKGRQLIDEKAPASNRIYAELEKSFGAKKMYRLLDLLDELAHLKL